MICSGKKGDNGVKEKSVGNTMTGSNAAIIEEASETIDMKTAHDDDRDVFSDSQLKTNPCLPIIPHALVNLVDNKDQKNLTDIRKSSPSPSKADSGVVTPTILPQISLQSNTPICNETSTHKGLLNHAGENNCFLNVAVQTLWHLGPFRYEMQKRIASRNNSKNGGSKNVETEMMEALCNLFVQYEHTNLSTMPSTELRKTLSGLFDECRLGEIADANETLEAILERIHQECTPMCPHGAHKCLAHNVFGGLLLEQATCRSCGASSEPKVRNDFMHYVYAAELITLNEKQRPGPDMLRSRFGNLLHECMEVSFRSCPSQDRNHFKGRILSSGANSPNTPNGGRSGAMTPNPMMEGKYTDKDILRAMEDEFSHREDHIILTDTTSALHSPAHSQAHSPLTSRKPSIVTPVEIECKCAAQVRIQAVEPPNVLAISVAWTSAKQSVGTLRSFLSLMSNTIQLADLFDVNEKTPSSNSSACNSPSRKSSLAASLSHALSSASRRTSVNSPSRKGSVNSPGRKSSVNSPTRKGSVNSPTRGKKVFPLGNDATGPSYTFRGFVCYYGSHYVSIFQDRSVPGNAKFMLFDDQIVRLLGGWDEVKRECLRSFYQPVLLLYELENSEAEVFHNGLQLKEKKEFVEKHLGNKKPREKSPQVESRPQYCASDMVRPGGPTIISQVIRGRSPSPKSWIIQDPDSGCITLDFPSDSSSQKLDLQHSDSLKSVHERPNSLTGYALSEIFASASCDSTNTIDGAETIRNPLISIHKEGRKHSTSNSSIQPIEIYKRRLLVSRVTLRLKKGEEDSNSPKTPPKGIIRSLFDEPEKNILGIIHGMNKKGHCVVEGFKKHPVKGRKYAAENSGLIFLDDRILSVENQSLHKMKKDDIKALVHGFLHEKHRESITIEVESSSKTAVWYICPYCSKDNKITEEEVVALKTIREQIIADHDSIALKARLLQECLAQPHENHLKTQIENNCGKDHIMEYHFTRRLLCVCRNCQFPSSASNLFHLNLFN